MKQPALLSPVPEEAGVQLGRGTRSCFPIPQVTSLHGPLAESSMTDAKAVGYYQPEMHRLISVCHVKGCSYGLCILMQIKPRDQLYCGLLTVIEPKELSSETVFFFFPQP